jgi:hypothetical protein
MAPLGFQDLQFCPARPSAFLPADLLDTLLLFRKLSKDGALNLLKQELPGAIPILGLGALLLAFDFNPRKEMTQVDAGGNFIDILIWVHARG